MKMSSDGVISFPESFPDYTTIYQKKANQKLGSEILQRCIADSGTGVCP